VGRRRPGDAPHSSAADRQEAGQLRLDADPLPNVNLGGSRTRCTQVPTRPAKAKAHRARRWPSAQSYGHAKPLEEWRSAQGSPLRAISDWGVRADPEAASRFNAYGNVRGKSGRGRARAPGRNAIVRRAGRRLVGATRGAHQASPVLIDAIAQLTIASECAVLHIGGLRVDAAVHQGAFRAVRDDGDRSAQWRRDADTWKARVRNSGRYVELELQQARYEASLAERRYAAAIRKSPHRAQNRKSGRRHYNASRHAGQTGSVASSGSDAKAS